MTTERMAWLCMNDWAGYHETAVLVVGETKTRYRIRTVDERAVRLGGRGRFLGALGSALVPKRAIRFVSDSPARGGPG